MEKAEEVPKRPLTPFFLFREKEKTKGRAMGGKEAGAAWNAMSEEEKLVYVEEYKQEREKFDTYLEEEGIPRRLTAAADKRPAGYISGSVRSLCGTKEEIKELSSKQLRALALVAV